MASRGADVEKRHCCDAVNAAVTGRRSGTELGTEDGSVVSRQLRSFFGKELLLPIRGGILKEKRRKKAGGVRVEEGSLLSSNFGSCIFFPAAHGAREALQRIPPPTYDVGTLSYCRNAPITLHEQDGLGLDTCVNVKDIIFTYIYLYLHIYLRLTDILLSESQLVVYYISCLFSRADRAQSCMQGPPTYKGKWYQVSCSDMNITALNKLAWASH